MTTPGPTTLAARWRSALLVLALVFGVLIVAELLRGNLAYALLAGAVAFVCVIAGARPRGGT
ncbi:MAG: hypothetical protein JWM40_1174 [Frankiales bacterium]|nr:hypothetical protein [Frankiales bacterium]